MIPFQLHRPISLLRRPFEQRDQAIRERDAAITERDGLRAGFIETANAELPATPFARTSSPAIVDDDPIMERVVAAYRASIAMQAAPRGSFWDGAFFDMKRDIHKALVADDFAVVQRMLRDPGKTDLFYGFDNLSRSIPTGGSDVESSSIEVYRDLLLLSEAIGARRLWRPESPKQMPSLPDVETLLNLLDRAVGVQINFPNPFPGEIGLATSRGVASYRAVQALYQAWRIFSLAKGNTGARVAEIGAGMGRTALYAAQLGLRDYTIVDLPLTAVAQGNFLCRTLGPDKVCLFGENRPGVRVLPPAAFLHAADRYDIVVNVDSLTEMARDTALAYCQAIKARAGLFLSVNHEQNQFTAREVCAEVGMPAATRTPYWMRRGYTDEVYTLPS